MDWLIVALVLSCGVYYGQAFPMKEKESDGLYSYFAKLMREYKDSEVKEKLKDNMIALTSSTKDDPVAFLSEDADPIEELKDMIALASSTKDDPMTVLSGEDADPKVELKDMIALASSEKDDPMAFLSTNPNLRETRYVGAGYNLVRGAPEGDFRRGGVDPGININNHIFRFTYDAGKTESFLDQTWNVPDQVNYQLLSSCSGSTERRAYSGMKSYQSSLSTSVEGEGSYGLYSFSASASFSEARSSTESSNKVVVDQKEICNYGTIRLKEYGVSSSLPAVTDEFIGAVRALSDSYDQAEYFRFIESWGTHIIFDVNVGTKKISRFSSTYESSYQFLQRSSSAAIGVGYDSLAASGSIEISIDTLNQKAVSGSTFGSTLYTYDIGTREVPLPIHMELRPIHEALDRKYWNNLPGGVTYDSLQIAARRSNLARAFEAYPSEVGRTPTDPTLSIYVKWPKGQYGFPESSSGCPVGFVRGCRYQDTEDSNNKNAYTNQNLLKRGQFDRDFELCYCVRQTDSPSSFQWQPGRYCIARRESSCQSLGFHEGSLFWDDQDWGNANRVHGQLPQGQYDRNTKVDYCCRGDGDPNQPILLPTSKPFVLYQYSSRGCQQVRGMRSTEIILYTDDEDINNKNRCDGAHPYDNNCRGRDHRVFMCHYQK